MLYRIHKLKLLLMQVYLYATNLTLSFDKGRGSMPACGGNCELMRQLLCGRRGWHPRNNTYYRIVYFIGSLHKASPTIYHNSRDTIPMATALAHMWKAQNCNNFF